MSTNWRFDEMQVAQHVIATLVASVCEGQGNELSFCKRANVSTVFVSNIRNRKQVPTMAMARHMLGFMNLPRHEGEAWLDHVALYWQLKRSSESAVIRVFRAIPETVLDELTYTHVRGRYAAEPALSHMDMSIVVAMAEPIVAEVAPETDFMAYLRVCSVLHEAYTSAGRLVDAAHLSKWMQCVAHLGLSQSNASMRHSLEHEVMSAMYQEMVTLLELGMFRHAFVLGQRIERLPAFHVVRNHWFPMLGWDRLVSFAHMRRSSIREAERIAHQAVATCEAGGGILLGLCQLLVTRALAEVCISHDSRIKATRLIDQAAELVATERYVGPLHHVLFLRTLARYYRSIESHSSLPLRRTVAKAIAIADEAGLRAQSWYFIHTYGVDSAKLADS